MGKKNVKIIIINSRFIELQCFDEAYFFNTGQQLGYCARRGRGGCNKNKYKRKRSETKCRNVCQQSCKRRRRVGERAEGGREGVRGKSAAMCWGVHLYPEQVFSAPLAGPLIRNRHACLVPSKASLSPISAAQALGKMMLN